MNRELDNYFAVVHDLAAGLEEWQSRPSWLEFSPNNVCNLRCIMCGQADGLPVESMAKEDTIRVLDELLPLASLITPSALSEPMLANIKLITSKCREHNCFFNFYTNAMLLDGAKFREIADRIQKVWVSFDSPDPETFEKLRAPASFTKVVDNIREFLPIANEMNIPVGFVAVLMRENAPQIADLVDFLADLGAVESRSDLRVQPMMDNSARCQDSDVHAFYDEKEICAFLDHAVSRAEARGMLFRVDLDEPYRRTVAPHELRIRGIFPDIFVHLMEVIRERYPYFCHMGATYVKVSPNGDVHPCCVAADELYMGNILETPFDQIWNGEKYRLFRRRMNERRYPEVCSTCDHLVANPAFKRL